MTSSNRYTSEKVGRFRTTQCGIPLIYYWDIETVKCKFIWNGWRYNSSNENKSHTTANHDPYWGTTQVFCHWRNSTIFSLNNVHKKTQDFREGKKKLTYNTCIDPALTDQPLTSPWQPELPRIQIVEVAKWTSSSPRRENDQSHPQSSTGERNSKKKKIPKKKKEEQSLLKSNTSKTR